MFELAAIYSKKENGCKVIRLSDFIAVEDGRLIEADHATHKVIGLFAGGLDRDFEILLTDVITNEPTIIKL